MTSTYPEIRIQNRQTRGSVKKALQNLHSETKWGWLEASLNSMTSEKDNPTKHKVITITEGVGEAVGIIEDCGIGFSKTVYKYLQSNEGYDLNDPDYIAKQDDPEYLNKMGIGMESIAGLSKTNIIEIQSISINEDDPTKETALRVKFVINPKTAESGFATHAEFYSEIGDRGSNRQNVLQRSPDAVQTGTKIIIPHPKPSRNLKDFLAKTLARKISQGYQIHYRRTSRDNWEQINKPKDFCCSHEEVLGWICDKFHPIVNLGEATNQFANKLPIYCSKCDGFPKLKPVYADLHRVDKKDQVDISLLIKKIRLGYLTDPTHLMKGYIGCDILEPLINREGITTDEENPQYLAFRTVIFEWLKASGRFELIPDSCTAGIKNEKRWKTLAQQRIINYFKQNREDELLKLRAIPQINALTGKLEHTNDPIKRPQTHEKCKDGFHWDSEQRKCVENEKREDTQTPKLKRKKPKKRNPGKLNPEDRNATADINVGSNPIGPDKWALVLDEKSSTLWFNTSHSWTEELKDSTDPLTMKMAVDFAIAIAVKENQNLSVGHFMSKIGRNLDGDNN